MRIFYKIKIKKLRNEIDIGIAKSICDKKNFDTVA